MGKDTSRRSKRVEVTFPRVSRRGRHLANVDDVIIYIQIWLWPGLLYTSLKRLEQIFLKSLHIIFIMLRVWRFWDRVKVVLCSEGVAAGWTKGKMGNYVLYVR